jgi:hypothetical protein
MLWRKWRGVPEWHDHIGIVWLVPSLHTPGSRDPDGIEVKITILLDNLALHLEGGLIIPERPSPIQPYLVRGFPLVPPFRPFFRPMQCIFYG